MIVIPKEIYKKFDTKPEERGFYKHFNSRGKHETKTKYKFFIEELDILDLYSFVVGTSKENTEYKYYFAYTKSDIEELDNIDGKYLSEKGFIYVGSGNELFDFIDKDDYHKFLADGQIKKIGYLKKVKFKELKSLLNNPKAIKNYNTRLKFDFSVGDEFLKKYL